MPTPPAASTSNTKTCTVDLAPHLPANLLTAILGLPVENLTVANLDTLKDAISRVSGGNDPHAKLGALLR